MVGRFFGGSSLSTSTSTPDHHGGVGGPAVSLNTPKGASASSAQVKNRNDRDTITSASSSSTTTSMSRRERIEQARRDRDAHRSRRRNFAFLKHGGSSMSSSFRQYDDDSVDNSNGNVAKSNSSSNIRKNSSGSRGNSSSIGSGHSVNDTKRREHAKQLANFAYADDPPLPPPAAAAAAAEGIFDPFGSAAATSKSLKGKLGSSGQQNHHHSHVSTINDPSASTAETWESTSFGSSHLGNAFDVDFASSPTPSSSSSPPIPSVQQQQQQKNKRSSPRSNSSRSNNNSHVDTAAAGSSGGMKTFPSNSTMQSTQYIQSRQPSSSFSSTGNNSSANNAGMRTPPQRRHKQQQQQQQQQQGGGNVPTPGSAAARRRMRSRMRGSNNSSFDSSNNHNVSSNNSVGSLESNQSFTSAAGQQQQHFTSAQFSTSMMTTPPESPASVQSRMTNTSVYSVGGGSSAASKNRLAAYQQRTGANVSGSGSFNNGYGGGGGGGSSVASSSANSGNTPNLFDPDNVFGGFTFDAFGLDQSQVERDVDEAMQELAGQGMSGFSFFVSPEKQQQQQQQQRHHQSPHRHQQQQPHRSSQQASFPGMSPTPSRNMFRDDDSSFGQSDNDSFAPHQQGWETGSNTSRNTSSPVPPHDGDGFENGFRVSQTQPSPHQQQQQTASSPSPATPMSASARRLQRSRRRGTTTPTTATPPPPTMAAASTPPVQQQQQFNKPQSASRKPMVEPLTPPRWEDADSSRKFTQASPHTAANAFQQDPVVKNPWSEDPWASDTSGGGGMGSDFGELGGTTMSEVQDYRGMYGGATDGLQNSGRRDYSDAKSDVGGRPSSVRSHVQSFYQLPPEEPKSGRGHGLGDDDDDDSDHSDVISQMQEDMASEFARDLVRRISPTKTQHSPTQQSFNTDRQQQQQQQQTHRVLDYGEGRQTNTAQHQEASPHANSITSRRKFGSFRSRYESSRGEAATSAQDNTEKRQLDNPHIGQKDLYSVSAKPTEKSPSQTSKLNRQDSTQQRFDDNEYISEEKKIDDPHVPSSSVVQSSVPKVGSLKARWEAQTRPKTAPIKPAATVPSRPVISEKARESIGNLDNSFEMLTPDIVEARRLEKNRARVQNLRKSVGVVDSPKANRGSSKSEVGESRYNGGAVERVLERVRSPRSTGMNGDMNETKSDGGSTPSFLANVQLRKVASPVNVHTTEEDRRQVEKEEVAAGAGSTSYQESPEQPRQSPVEKLTYRQRRELELERERDEQMKLEVSTKETPKKDVASLIRKRIAANKQKTASDSTDVPTGGSLSNGFNRSMKPIEKENITQGTSQGISTNVNRTQASPRNAPSPRDRFAQNLTSPQSKSPSVRQPPAQFVSPHDERTGTNTSSPYDTTVANSMAPSSSPGFGTDEIEEAPYRPEYDQVSGTSDRSSPQKALSPKSAVANLLASRQQAQQPASTKQAPAPSHPRKPDVCQKVEIPDDVPAADVKSMLSSFLGSRAPPALPLPAKEDDSVALQKHHVKSPKDSSPSKEEHGETAPPPPPEKRYTGSRPALKDDPKYERYFRMLKMGLPVEVAKHAMERDGMDPSILDLDHDKPVGVPLKEDPKFEKYFKMLKIGIQMDQVKHAMERDGLNPDVMDQDHNLPVMNTEKKQEKKQKETHRRARLHWKTIGNVVRNSLWAKVEKEIDDIDIDEDEFEELFKADLQAPKKTDSAANANKKKGAAVRVIDAKRANNGGIILARLKMTHDEMADAVDRIDSDVLSAEQIENIIEYLPTKDERDSLEKYMLEGGQDAAEKFDGLCECEKFMVSMMTVKHAKRKIRALLFKLQFLSCMESIAEDAQTIDNACDELLHSNRLRQLLGIILHFGNKLNTSGVNSKGKAGAFSLDSLSKLSQAKAFDKKTTFLHYIVLIVQRNNELLLKYYDDVPTVLKADKVFWDQCLQDLEEVENQLENVRRISLYEAKVSKQYQLPQQKKHDDDDTLDDVEDLTLEEEVISLRATQIGLFTLGAIKQVSALRDKIDRTREKFARVLEYFGEGTKNMQPQELFAIIASFTRDFQKAKEEVFTTVSKRLREDRKKARNQATPNQKKGLPPAAPERSPQKPMMKASSHQPNMSSLFSDIKKRGSASADTNTSGPPNSQHGTNSMAANHNALMNSLNRANSSGSNQARTTSSSPQFRNFHHPSRIPEETTAMSPEGDNSRSPSNNTTGPVSIALAPTTTTTHRSNPAPSGTTLPRRVRSPREALRIRQQMEARKAQQT